MTASCGGFARAAACAIALALAGPAAAGCSGGFICIDAVRTEAAVEIRAANLRPVPLTFTVRVRTRDLAPENPAALTATLDPHESRLLMTLHPTRRDREGKYRIAFDWTVGSLDAVHDDHYVYRLPYAPGTSWRVLQGYGSRFSHTGLEEYAVDFRMPEGTPVHAARGGIVAKVEESNSRGCWEDGCGAYANYIVILHDDLTTGEYYHLRKDGALVEPGDRVVAGQQIGYSGNTGHTTMPHLHFAVYRAAEWGRTQSLPVRFQTAEGIVERPRRGARYGAPQESARLAIQTVTTHIAAMSSRHDKSRMPSADEALPGRETPMPVPEQHFVNTGVSCPAPAPRQAG